MMFGLPAAALAIHRAARPENRRVVGGLLAAAAVTSLLTGVTEPIEFAYRIATRPLALLAVGVAFGLAYFVIFRVAIERLDLPTPGREGATDRAPSRSSRAAPSTRA